MATSKTPARRRAAPARASAAAAASQEAAAPTAPLPPAAGPADAPTDAPAPRPGRTAAKTSGPARKAAAKRAASAAAKGAAKLPPAEAAADAADASPTKQQTAKAAAKRPAMSPVKAPVEAPAAAPLQAKTTAKAKATDKIAGETGAPAAGKTAARKTAATQPAAARTAAAEASAAEAPAAPKAAAKKSAKAPATASASKPDLAAAAGPGPAEQAPRGKAAANKAPKPAAGRPARQAARQTDSPSADQAPAEVPPAPATAPAPSPAATPRQPEARKAKAPRRQAAPAAAGKPTAEPSVAPPAAPPAALPDASPAEPAAPPAGRPGPSRWLRTGDDHWQLTWQPGRGAPAALRAALAPALAADGTLPPEAADTLLPATLRLAAEAGHPVEVDPAIWPLLAAERDRRTRVAWLAALYPDGPASPALAGLLSVPLAPFQAEGALWAVVAGRALLADDPGLGKGVQAIAAARLWQRHFGVDRVLVLCAPAQRPAWQQAWWRLAGERAQVMPGTLMQRSGQWAAPAAVRILSAEALTSDAAALAGWEPQLVIIDEPQRLALDDAAWAALAAVPQAIVLCGAALDATPDLLERLIDWLDPQRLGPRAAWRQLRAARDEGQPLDEDAVEAVSDALSRVLLQRQRADLADQLPPVVQATRWIPLGEAQRAAHEAALARAERLVAGWQRSGYLADADQWRLSECMVAMQQAAHRADPQRADSPLSEAVLQALAGQLDDWAESGDQPVWLRCDRAEDAAQLTERLGEHLSARPGVRVLGPGERPTGEAGRVLQIGAPWRLPHEPLAGDGLPGQHWVAVAAEDSLDQGLIDTLALRGDAPRGPAEPGGSGFLTGERLADWLHAIAAALAALQATRTAFAAG